ncbi:MAG: Ni-sirohydrochlorin a,c-diamide synthase [Methanomicrobiales archaeon]|nr:Ni-sirohydrochlorin a,c-diamide synthase [Methanomicrobiales archaeon]
MKAFMIAGDRSGAGKTSISLGIASLLSDRYRVQTCKVGMDYIDPSYLSAASGRPCRNLDGFVMDEANIRTIVDFAAQDADILLVEGVRGLYEGAEALTDRGSSAEIAKLLGIPVVLVVNARSITRSAAALVQGFIGFDPEISIRGVILNNVFGASHRDKAIQAIEKHCGIPVLGSVPPDEGMVLEMRHLGLVPYREGEGNAAFRETVQAVRKTVGSHVNMEGILTAAGEYQPGPVTRSVLTPAPYRDIRIGVAYDEAFNFYYADLFDVLRGCGAEPVFFSPVHDPLPEADGYILGGGYPELYAKELEENTRVREALKQASANGIPLYGECGGLIYLTEGIRLSAGWRGAEKEAAFSFCGAVPGITRMPAKRVVSYVEGASCPESPLGGGAFRGHEFHYSDVILAPPKRFCYHLIRGRGIEGENDGVLVKNTLASYTHLSPVPSAKMFDHFVRMCRSHPKT